MRGPFRRFLLVRQVDVSGTGPVAEGGQWSSGKAALDWLSEVPSSGVYDSVDDVLTVQGRRRHDPPCSAVTEGRAGSEEHCRAGPP